MVYTQCSSLQPNKPIDAAHSGDGTLVVSVLPLEPRLAPPPRVFLTVFGLQKKRYPLAIRAPSDGYPQWYMPERTPTYIEPLFRFHGLVGKDGAPVLGPRKPVNCAITTSAMATDKADGLSDLGATASNKWEAVVEPVASLRQENDGGNLGDFTVPQGTVSRSFVLYLRNGSVDGSHQRVMFMFVCEVHDEPTEGPYANAGDQIPTDRIRWRLEAMQVDQKHVPSDMSDIF